MGKGYQATKYSNLLNPKSTLIMPAWQIAKPNFFNNDLLESVSQEAKSILVQKV